MLTERFFLKYPPSSLNYQLHVRMRKAFRRRTDGVTKGWCPSMKLIFQLCSFHLYPSGAHCTLEDILAFDFYIFN